MKTIIAILIFLSFQESQASMLEAARELNNNADDLNGSVLTMFKVTDEEYLNQARTARDAVCKNDSNFRQISAQNIWAEIQSAAKIQKLTTLKYFETCGSVTTGTQEFCSNANTALEALYREIQGCAYARIEERAPVLAQKLNKRRILSCTTAAPYPDYRVQEMLGADVYFVNTRYADLSFDEIKNFSELDVSICKLGSKEYDLKKILVYTAVNICMKKHSIDYESCLSTACPTNSLSCRTDKRDACYAFAMKKEREFTVENINKCLTEEILNPSDANVKSTKAACAKGRESAFANFDTTIRRVGFSTASRDCFRSADRCKTALENAFMLQEVGDICSSNKTYSAGNPNSGNTTGGSK